MKIKLTIFIGLLLLCFTLFNCSSNPGGGATDAGGNGPYTASSISSISHSVVSASGWSYKTLDSIGDLGYGVSIAIDSNDFIHISYLDYKTNSLRYATNASGSWVCQTVETLTSGAACKTGIAVDSNNKIHISYYMMNKGLKYATNLSGSWVCLLIGGGCEGDTSIAVDSKNKIHIAYYNYQNSRCLMYATNQSGTWVYTSLYSFSYGLEPSIAVDSKDKVHIIYFNGANNKTEYVNNVTGSWECVIVDPSAYFTGYAIMGIDANDKIHICYKYGYLGTNNDYLKYATNASGSWTYEFLDSASPGCPSIAFDSNNKIHISYSQQGTSINLRYATNTSGSWEYTDIDKSNNVGSISAIAIDSNNLVHIAYMDDANIDLKYATNK